jgi:hypothetical protein
MNIEMSADKGAHFVPMEIQQPVERPDQLQIYYQG